MDHPICYFDFLYLELSLQVVGVLFKVEYCVYLRSELLAAFVLMAWIGDLGS